MENINSKPGYEQLRTVSRQLAAKVWKDYRAGLQLEGELAIMAESMAEHPEWIGLWDSLDSFTDEDILTADGVNPLARIAVDMAVKEMISQSGEKTARRAYQQLISEGVPESEARDEIGRIFLGWLWTVQKEKIPPHKTRRLLLSYLNRLTNGETAVDIFP